MSPCISCAERHADCRARPSDHDSGSAVRHFLAFHCLCSLEIPLRQLLLFERCHTNGVIMAAAVDGPAEIKKQFHVRFAYERQQALLGGGPAHITKQHALFDCGTFREL